MEDINVEKYPFHIFCSTLEKIAKTDSKDDKKEIFKTFINKFNIDAEQLFSILRLILPHIDKNRPSYNIKEATIGKIVANLYGISPGTDYYKQLYLNEYPEVKRPKDYGYLVSTMAYEFNKRDGSICTISDINNSLTELSQTHSTETLKSLLSQLSPMEVKWLIRMILRDVRLRLESQEILCLVDPYAALLYDQNNDLYSILKNTINRETTKLVNTIQLFQFVRPMLSIKASKKLLDQLHLSGYYVEEKFDGERFQFHYDKNASKWFSRTGNIYTTFSNLTNEIQQVVRDDVRNVVLDGEMIGYNTKTRKYGTKGFNYDIKKHTELSTYQPCFVVFDILLYNDDDLTSLPLSSRRKYLEKLLPADKEFVIKKSHCSIINNAGDLVKYLNDAIKKDLEGIIIKDPLSTYLPNKRTPKWIKVKPEYFEGLIMELDLIILGGFYGDGRRSGQIATFLLGVLDNENEEMPVYKSVSDSGLGLTNVQLQKLQLKLVKHWNKVDKAKKPDNARWQKTNAPHVWIEPEHSVILEMKASELHRSDKYVTSHTLRFPRITRIRFDKPVDQCMTLQEFNEIIASANGPVVKLSKRLATTNDLLTTASNFPSEGLIRPKVEIVSDILMGKEFFVLAESQTLTKSTLEQLILANGGQVTKSDKCIFLAGKMNFSVETEMKLGKRDVVKIEWLLNVLKNGSYRNYSPLDVYSACEHTKRQFNVEYDRYFDHFTQHATVESLQRCFDLMPDSEFMDIDVDLNLYNLLV